MKVKFNLKKESAYVVAGLLILATGFFIVSALSPGVSPNPGHLITQIAPPSGCTNGQVLGWNGGSWGCIDMASGGSSAWTKSGTTVYYSSGGISSGKVGIGTSSPIHKLDVIGNIKGHYVYTSRVYDRDNNKYYSDPSSVSKLHSIETAYVKSGTYKGIADSCGFIIHWCDKGNWGESCPTGYSELPGRWKSNAHSVSMTGAECAGGSDSWITMCCKH